MTIVIGWLGRISMPSGRSHAKPTTRRVGFRASTLGSGGENQALRRHHAEALKWANQQLGKCRWIEDRAIDLSRINATFPQPGQRSVHALRHQVVDNTGG